MIWLISNDKFKEWAYIFLPPSFSPYTETCFPAKPALLATPFSLYMDTEIMLPTEFGKEKTVSVFVKK